MEDITACCRYLKGEPEYRCTVLDETYVPSFYQIEEYCKTIYHTRCPFYLGDREELSIGIKEMQAYLVL